MPPDPTAIGTRIAQWTAAAPVLQEVRDRDIREADTSRSLRNLSGIVLRTASRLPERTTSGLVTQQRVFLKLRSA